jgi:hypothetical protein
MKGTLGILKWNWKNSHGNENKVARQHQKKDLHILWLALGKFTNFMGLLGDVQAIGMSNIYCLVTAELSLEDYISRALLLIWKILPGNEWLYGCKGLDHSGIMDGDTYNYEFCVIKIS